jgi:tRNA-Thr(GGU) m(6)t(6)A37 methyltransferase TsaA
MKKVNEQIVFEPIGYVRCGQKYRYEAPRQAVFAQNEGIIELIPGRNYEQAVRDLKGFDRIWVIYNFHLNDNWKPLVKPPVAPNGRKISVFATRSPHRPNPLGMSCVELVNVDGLTVHIRNFDMLDGSPVLDIKPYIPCADSFPESKTGWLESADSELYSICFSDQARKRIDWIFENSNLDIDRFCQVQLGSDPLNEARKRVQALADDPDNYEIGCRTWKIKFKLDLVAKTLQVITVQSNYTAEELVPGTEDKYSDKDIHRAFSAEFN